LEDLRELQQETALMELLGREVIPDPVTVGDWLRRMGDPHTGQAGLAGLGQVRGLLKKRLLRHDGTSDAPWMPMSFRSATSGCRKANALPNTVPTRAPIRRS